MNMNISNRTIEDVINSYQTEFFFVKDKNSNYIQANSFFLSFFGVSQVEKLCGMTDYHLFSVDLAEKYVQDDQHVLQMRELQVIERTRRYDGCSCFILTNKYSFCDPSTQQPGVVGISRVLNDNALKSIRSVVDTANCHSLKISDTLFKTKVNQHAWQPLTNRELDVLYYLLHGFSQKRIGDKLSLSVRTVEDHIVRVKHKLKCANKDQLCEFAIFHGITSIVPRHVFDDAIRG